MASSKEDMDHKLTFRMFEDGDYTWGNFGDQIFREDTSHKCPTYVHRTPPCQGSCPSGEDIRGWLQIVRGIEKPQVEDMSMQEYAFLPFPFHDGSCMPCTLPRWL